MTLIRVWHTLLYLGDGAVLGPSALLLFAWLIAAPATRRTAGWWLLALVLVGGAVALSKMLYMVSGWHPAGWNFIGMSGHAALSFLFWPAAGALLIGRHRPALRVTAVALGACLALGISVASWVLREHSFSEIVLGGLWGALVAAVFLIITWRHATKAPSVRKWMIVSLAVLVMVTFRHQFPSTGVLGWVAMRASGHTEILTRADLAPKGRLSKSEWHGRHEDARATGPHEPSQLP